MKDLLIYILENTVPEANATVEEQEQDGFVRLTITVPQEFMGKVIGKGGKNISAVKNILKIRAIKEGKKVEVDVVEK
ncbi:MAG TPA: KH domain-containing protein [Candidatus Levybacteria bacterium]|nr:KH domain-containing protein [Candidatus Levybacteria bacterium]